MYRMIVLAILGFACAILSSCGRERGEQPFVNASPSIRISPYRFAEHFTDRGLPREEYLVGRGAKVSYIAPVHGAALYVDLYEGRFLATCVIWPGEKKVFLSPETEHDSRLYFIPYTPDARISPFQDAHCFTKHGLPREDYLVGRGGEISYISPADGTVFLIEHRLGRYLRTHVVRAGEQCSFSVMQPEGDIRLYFMPEPSDVQ